MDLTELQQFEEMEQLLRSWDWKADLRSDERSYAWLARRTGKAQRSVYDYAYGKTNPPLDWLRAAYRVLKVKAA